MCSSQPRRSQEILKQKTNNLSHTRHVRPYRTCMHTDAPTTFETETPAVIDL